MSQRLEVELVRELELAYASNAAPATVDYAAPFQWANACHDLFETGRLDICEYSARYLHKVYPELAYLATLVALFDAIPRHLPPPLAFSDDPAAEIQIVQRPHSRKALLCFCAADGTLGFPLNLVHQWIGRLPASVVYIKDFRDLSGGCGYPTLGADRRSAVAAFRQIVDRLDVRKTCTLGLSVGGYAALYYGLELGADAVLNLGGAIDYTPDFVNSLGPVSKAYPKTHINLCKYAPDYATNMRDVYAAAATRPRILMAYGTGNPLHCAQASRIAGMPNIDLIPLTYAGLNVLDPLIREDKLLPLLLRLLSETQIEGTEAGSGG